MGDAGPPTPPPGLAHEQTQFSDGETPHAPVREVRVLVTGFGPFKSFLVNPSWLIASSLPNELYPPSLSPSSPPPYKIRLIVYPQPIRVSYSVVTSLVPNLVLEHDPDYILHIGMAGGRDCYSLETRAHRDGYRIKDVDEGDGFSCGEVIWKREGIPDLLMTAWDEDEVLKRWEESVESVLNGNGSSSPPAAKTSVSSVSTGIVNSFPTSNATATPVPPSPRTIDRQKSIVKLSRDAGRFLCEFALFESLSRRWLDDARYQRGEADGKSTGPDRPEATSTTSASGFTSESSSDISTKHSSSPHSSLAFEDSITESRKGLAHERLGKVAFLHVPGWTGVEDVRRGVVVAEEAIRAIVTSWEDGYRRGGKVDVAVVGDEKKYTTQHSENPGEQAVIGSAAIRWRV